MVLASEKRSKHHFYIPNQQQGIRIESIPRSRLIPLVFLPNDIKIFIWLIVLYSITDHCHFFDVDS